MNLIEKAKEKFNGRLEEKKIAIIAGKLAKIEWLKAELEKLDIEIADIDSGKTKIYCESGDSFY